MELKIYKGKVVDEPETWVHGELISADCIYQKNPDENCKCCGVGMFTVDPETVQEIN
jgi:hypothetical protein|nr:MAG TPA: hypothetical protein [Caudoviricetes sp.]